MNTPSATSSTSSTRGPKPSAEPARPVPKSRIHVKAHLLRNVPLAGWRERMVGRISYQELVADPKWFHGWISFDAVTFNPRDGMIYCGLNSLDGDLLYRFDPAKETFEGLGTRQWTDRYDVKIHRTLLANPDDGCLYFGTSLLHDLDDQKQARGGKLVRYDPSTGRYELLATPAPRLYLQSIAADWSRAVIYSFTYPAESVIRTDLRTRQSELVAYIGNSLMLAQPHNAVVDRNGWLWGTWAETRAWDEITGPQPIRLFKYHPGRDELIGFDHGLPRWDQPEQLLPELAPATAVSGALAGTRHRTDHGFCDSMAYDGGRYIYAGTVAGVLCRIDIDTGKVEKLANAVSTGRFPALAIQDGVLHGAGGMNGQTQLIRWDTRSDRLERFSDLEDRAIGQRPARIHELAVADDGRVYLGENDNHDRSSYLWSVTFH